MLLGITEATLPGGMMGAYKGQIHENFDVVSDLTTTEIVSKMHINIQMILTSIFFPSKSAVYQLGLVLPR